MSTCTNHIDLPTVKQGTVARFLGCELQLLPDEKNPQEFVVFRATPSTLAEEAVQLLEGGELFPARALLDEYARLYREVRTFLKQQRRTGKEMADESRG
ncbi:MAG: hypothetical protein P4L44_16590 [Oryzomonas sp.]|uniref:hypothetical protein n=1 Tax=Oryzomonas sp. TaxID=2855186 RepID=UPI00284F5BAB|nr:hypothetical protein [Oryzomonas sp.]MDR3581581.1 hypothetical protein [Oryzomonas sp.]